MSNRIPKRIVEQCLAALLIIYFVFYEPLLAWTLRVIPDDQCYIKWLFLFWREPYSHCDRLFHLPGTPLLWFPVSVLARGVSFFGGDYQDWLLIGIGLESFFLWAGGLYFCLLTFWKTQPKRALKLHGFPLLFFLGLPALHFAVARSTMAHAAEVFLAFGAIYFLRAKKFTWAFVFSGFLSITRLNDLPLFFVVFIGFLEEKKFNLKTVVLLGACVFIACFPLTRRILFTGYDNDKLFDYVRDFDWAQFRYVLWGDHWGLFYTAPFWIFICAFLMIRLKKISWSLRVGLLWMLLQFVVVVGGHGMGSSFGYRYLIGTYAIVLMGFFELSPQLSLVQLRLLKVGLLFQALYLFHLNWVYDHFTSVPELLGRGEGGLLTLKQIFHPVIRFKESPLGVLIQSWGSPDLKSQFGAFFPTPAIWVNALICLLGLPSLGLLIRRQFPTSVPKKKPARSALLET